MPRDAFAIVTSWFDWRFRMWSTGFASAGVVLLNERPYVTQVPSPEICAPSMLRQRV